MGVKNFKEFDKINENEVNNFTLDPKLTEDINSITSNYAKEVNTFMEVLANKYREQINQTISDYLPSGYMIGNVNAGAWLFDENGEEISSDSPHEHIGFNETNYKILSELAKLQFPLDDIEQPALIDMEIYGK